MADWDDFRINRRTFVGASIAVGGAWPPLPWSPDARSQNPRLRRPEDTTVTLRINGKPHEITVDNRTSLLDMLRERAGLTGTKKGCDQGACGACTILVDGQRIELVPDAGGDARRRRDHHHRGARAQRPACTRCSRRSSTRTPSSAATARPGRSCPASAASRRATPDRPAEIREWMSGNICRCGAYTNIVTAVANAARST